MLAEIAATPESVFWELTAEAIRQHPQFWPAVRRHADETLAQHERLSPTMRWLTRDVGRAAVLARALSFDALTGCATAAHVLAKTAMRNTSSNGRVIQVIQRAERAGLLEVQPGPAAWAKRRLLLKPELIELFRQRAATEIGAASLVAPEAASALARLSDDNCLRRFLAALSRFDGMTPEMRGPRTPSIALFLWHEGGALMLRELIRSQPETRSRLLDAAAFSRTYLARRANVSRAHVGRLFREAEAAGWLTLSPRRVSFSPEMSDQLSWHYALTFQVMRASALAVVRA